ncbi:uncharacterized protein LOC123551928 [Mercenaria mercenaria]|uniref:uncharacterized protein LOC123551928 n=1 Tax=Mercenaria mercenaria TaxID=6596 RepID=UPI00234F1EEE|nr:uncharacterized protein LOC123551928 [Mercenaria mercenaria]
MTYLLTDCHFARFDSVYFQGSQLNIDTRKIEDRLSLLDKKTDQSNSAKRKRSLTASLADFLSNLPTPLTLCSCSPEDIRKFLVWKDEFGKTKIHTASCPYIGSSDSRINCACPLRLAAGTVEGVINLLCRIFEDHGFGRFWDSMTMQGNPVCSPIVKEYLTRIREEQAKANVLPKQAKPIFMSKLRSIARYIDMQLARSDITSRERYVLLRDQAWFKLQFFAGDRAGDLSFLLSQQVRSLSDGSGLTVTHTFGKTLRGNRGKVNEFVVPKCADTLICPVNGLNTYVASSKAMGVNLTLGYMFRIVSDSGVVLDQQVSYSVVYERMRHYLTVLGIYDGETPHSFRAGCAVSLNVAGCSSADIMDHVGWFGSESAEYYSRRKLMRSSTVAKRLARAVDFSNEVEDFYNSHADYASLPHAFFEHV